MNPMKAVRAYRTSVLREMARPARVRREKFGWRAQRGVRLQWSGFPGNGRTGRLA